jgi:hypothetical protein
MRVVADLDPSFGADNDQTARSSGGTLPRMHRAYEEAEQSSIRLRRELRRAANPDMARLDASRLLAITILLGPHHAARTGGGHRADFVDTETAGDVIVFRHVETDESQKDVYPFKFDDTSAQRQIADMAVSDRACTPCVPPIGVNPP